MGGYNRDPRVRLGLIALLAARRVKAETLRQGKPPTETPKDSAAAKAKTRKSGWFR